MSVTVVGRELAVRQPANLPAPATGTTITASRRRWDLPARAYTTAAGASAVTVAALLGPHPVMAAVPAAITAVLLAGGTFALVKGGI